MGKRQDGRIEPGQKLSGAISARAWNRAQDAADIVLGERTGFGAESGVSDLAKNIVTVKNTTSEQVPIMGVLELTGIAFNVATGSTSGTFEGTNAASRAVRQFFRTPVLHGVMPDGTRMFGVALEPIAPDKYGRMAVGGAIACRVKIISTAHGFARSRRNDVTQLISAPCGPVRLAWKEGIVGDGRWAAGIF